MSESKDKKKNSISTVAQRRCILVGMLALAPLVLLIYQLHSMQVVNGEKIRETTEKQYTRYVISPSVRGQIISADGVVLAGNRDYYDLAFFPSLMRNPRGIFLTSSDMLKKVTFLENEIFKRPSEIKNINLLRRRMSQDMAQPITVFKNITEEEIARCEELSPQIKGIAVVPHIERDYPFPGIATHLLGMTNWQDCKLPQKTYAIKELNGVNGLEKRFNSELAGISGIKVVLKDPNGFIREEKPGEILKEDGCDLILTIDSKAQIAADTVLKGRRGALIAIDVHSGAVIAMASAPTFDLSSMNSEYYAALSSDEKGRPLLHRALSGTYMPGSIVKPLVALAALESGSATKDTVFNCQGYYFLGNRKIACAKRWGHGELDMATAIAVSCNPYFIHTGITSKMENLSNMYRAVGFGRTTNFDIPEAMPPERVGTIPSEDTARRLWRRKWIVSDTAYVSIGQGALVITPLQAAAYVAGLANGGDIYRPFVVRQIRHQSGIIMKKTVPTVQYRIPATRENLDFIRGAMTDAVTMRGASANALQNAGIPLAAKTGTAEVGSAEKRTKNTWIICYGPLPNPEFAIACVIEDGESGGKTTAPIVVDFIRKWLISDN